MEENNSLSLIEKMILKINLSMGHLGLTPLYLGLENVNGVLNNFEAPKFLDSFGLGLDYYRNKEFDSLIVFGSINKNQAQLLSLIVEEFSSELKLVVHVRSGLSKRLRDKSKFLIQDISKIIPVDIEYNKYPVDLSKLSELIIEKQQGRING